MIMSKTMEPNVSKTIEQIMSKNVDTSKTIEQNVSQKNKAGTEKYFLSWNENILA